jgi:amino acid transporter
VSSFVTTYFPVPLFAVLFFGYKMWKKSKMITYADMDFVTRSSMDIPQEVNHPSNASFID